MQALSLTDDHELQVQAYLRFAKLKRDQHVREATATINDFKQERIRPGEMYNYKDMKEMFEDLEVETKKLVDQEIQNSYHTNALLVKILLSQAQVHGLELFVDTNQLENEFLLKQISSSEATALSRPPSDFVRRNTQLGKLGTVATVAMQDPQLVKERDALKAELAELKERMTKVQEETTKMMRERTTLNNQINTMKDEVAAKDAQLKAALGDKDAAVGKLSQDMAQLSAAAAGRSQLTAAEVAALQKEKGGLAGQLAALQEEVQAARNQLGLKDKELRAANDALNGKLQDCKQFVQMKSMMQAKSQEAATLRKRLERYEPQQVASAD